MNYVLKKNQEVSAMFQHGVSFVTERIVTMWQVWVVLWTALWAELIRPSSGYGFLPARRLLTGGVKSMILVYFTSLVCSTLLLNDLGNIGAVLLYISLMMSSAYLHRTYEHKKDVKMLLSALKTRKSKRSYSTERSRKHKLWKKKKGKLRDFVSCGGSLDSSYDMAILKDLVPFFRFLTDMYRAKTVAMKLEACAWFCLHMMANSDRLHFQELIDAYTGSSKLDDVSDAFSSIFLDANSEEIFHACSLPEKLHGARKFLTSVRDGASSDVLVKARKVALGLMCVPLVKKMGLKFSWLGMVEFQEKHLKHVKFDSSFDMIMSVSELLVLLAESGYECFIEQSARPLFKRNKDLLNFMDGVDKVQMTLDQQFANPDWDVAHILCDINELLMYGRILLKNPDHKSYVSRELNKIERWGSELRSRQNVSTYRRAPMGIMVCGPPGIGKSTIVNNLFAFYHQVVTTENIYPDLEWDPKKNSFTKNFMEDFWSGYYGARQWAILLDDIAQENVDHVKMGKVNSVSLLISLINTVGMASNQAELEMKGRVPIVPKIVVATTNVQHLNAFYAVAEPGAVLRRLPIQITPVLKPEFLDKETGIMKKLTYVEHDAWMYHIDEIKLSMRDNRTRATAVRRTKPDGSDLYTAQELYPWLREKIIIHEKNAITVEEANKVTPQHTLCKKCKCMLMHCTCKSVPKDMMATGLVERFVYRGENDTCSMRWVKWKLWCWFACICLGVYFFIPFCILRRFLPPRPPMETSYSDEVTRFLVRKSLITQDMYVVEKMRQLYREWAKPRYIAIALAGLLGSALFLHLCKKKIEEYPDYSAFGGPWDRSEEMFVQPKQSINDDSSQLVNTVEKSMVRLRIMPDDNPEGGVSLSGFNVGNGQIITNLHVFVGDTTWTIDALFGPVGKVQRHMRFRVTRDNFRMLHDDLLCINTSAIVPRRDLSEFLPDECSKQRGEIRVVGRDSKGELEVTKGILDDYGTITYGVRDTDVRISTHLALFQRERQTVQGDCGSLVLMKGARGWYVHSVVCAGSESTRAGCSIPICKSMLIEGSLAFERDDSYFAAGNGKSGPLGKLSTKNVFEFSSGGRADILGSFPGRATPISHVGFTKCGKELKTVLPLEKEYAAPAMRASCIDGEWRNPWVLAAEGQMNTASGFVDSKIQVCVSAMVDDWTQDMSWLERVKPYDQNTAINGLPERDYINMLPMSTSAGFIKPGPKRDLFEKESEGYVAKPWLQERIDSLLDTYSKGGRCNILMQGSLKSEPLPLEKVEAHKTRLFTACSVDFSIVVRQKFLGIAEAIMENNFKSECMAGMNHLDGSWEDLYDYLTYNKTDFDHIIAGDYSKFDKTMPAEIIGAAFDVLIETCKRTGRFSEEDLTIMRGIKTDICFPVTSYNGDVAMFFGGNSSGHPLTLIVNSIANSLYMRYVFGEITGRPISDFREFVRLATLGDDNIMNSKLEEFNHTAIAEAFVKLGVKYTMPDKESETVPFVNIHDTDFLKRKFVFLNGKVVAPLSLESTYKMLVYGEKSKYVTPEKQAADCYLSARREWALHGEEVFNWNVARVDPIMRSDEVIVANMGPKHELDWEVTFDWMTNTQAYEEEEEIVSDLRIGDFTSVA